MSGPLDFDDDARSAPERQAPAEDGPPERPAPASGRYGWFLGLVAVVLLVVVVLNAVGTESVGGGPAAGQRLIPFAVPLAAAAPRPDGREDANLSPGACRVRGPGVVNLCAIAERGPLVLALFPTGSAECRGVLDQLERVRDRLGDVQVVAVGSEGERSRLASPPRPFPVGWDRDRAVASAYGLVTCPQLTFARRGGEVAATVRGPVSDDELVRRARALSER